jgi:hypothetical protein
MVEAHTNPTRCPICGRGELVDVAFDAGTGEAGSPPRQLADSSEIDVYRCGHEVVRSSLDRADDTLDVERRSSEETAQPSPDRSASAGSDGSRQPGFEPPPGGRTRSRDP